MLRSALVVVFTGVVITLTHAAPSAVVTFSMDDLTFTQFQHGGDTYQIPAVREADHRVDSAGTPYLPFKSVHILIPQDRTCTGVTVSYLDTTTVPGTFFVYPTQTPVAMGGESGPFVEPDSTIYSSESPFPASPALRWREGHRSGYRIVTIQVYPLAYRPASRHLTFNGEVRITLELAAAERIAVPVLRRSALAQAHLAQLVAAAVDNSEDVDGYDLGESYQPDGGDGRGRVVITELPTRQGLCVDYVVITSAELLDSYQPLTDWKMRTGVVAAARSTSWIEQHYTGCDLQERIRNFIKDAYSSWGTIWVLIGGDVSVVPSRLTGVGFPGHVGPTDLYYADLEGNWNRNGDAWFGLDENDLEEPLHEYLADVGLGRVPADCPDEVSVFVDKCMTYTKDPPSAPYLASALMSAAGNGLRYEPGGDTNRLFGFGCKTKEGIIGDIIERYWPDMQVWEQYGPQLDTFGYLWEGNELLTNQSIKYLTSSVGGV